MGFNLYSDDGNAGKTNGFEPPQGGKTAAQDGLLQYLLDEEQSGILIRSRKGVEEITLSQEATNSQISRTVFSPKFNRNFGVRRDLTPTTNLQ